MGKFDVIGTEQKLKQSASDTMPQKTEGGNWDLVGSTIALNSTPQGTGWKMNGGNFDTIGSTVKLGKEGHPGWGDMGNVAENQVKK